MLSAYQNGFQDGLNASRHNRVRIYETDKAEKEYWRGYANGVRFNNPDKMTVRCEREGKVFATIEKDEIVCPTCGRTYIREEGHWESDRRLTILPPDPVYSK